METLSHLIQQFSKKENIKSNTLTLGLKVKRNIPVRSEAVVSVSVPLSFK